MEFLKAKIATNSQPSVSTYSVSSAKHSQSGHVADHPDKDAILEVQAIQIRYLKEEVAALKAKLDQIELSSSVEVVRQKRTKKKDSDKKREKDSDKEKPKENEEEKNEEKETASQLENQIQKKHRNTTR